MELVGPSKRRIASVFTGMFFSIGQMSLGIIAYYFRDYQHLQAAITLPAIIFVFYWWYVIMLLLQEFYEITFVQPHSPPNFEKFIKNNGHILL